MTTAVRARVAWRPGWKRLLTAAFFAAVAALLVLLARNVPWAEVLATLRATPAVTLLRATAAALGSYLVYSSFDVLGKIYTRHHLPVRRILPVTFVAYAFNLNLSAWIGSIGFRYRLYARLGLTIPVITRILSFSLMTNWLGYIALAGVLFGFGQVTLPPDWRLTGGVLRALGLALLAVVALYLGLCAGARRRSFTVRGHLVELPPLSLALAQLGLGACNWSLMALTIHLLLDGRVDYLTVLGVLLLAAIAGVAAHIPAGLGVLEGVFVALVGHQVPQPVLLAALIGYRAVYFLLPLVIASGIYLAFELASARAPRR